MYVSLHTLTPYTSVTADTERWADSTHDTFKTHQLTSKLIWEICSLHHQCWRMSWGESDHTHMIIWLYEYDYMIIWIWLYGAFTEANISCTLIYIMSTWCLVFCEFESFYTNLNQLWIRTHLLSSLDHFHQADVSVLFLFHNKTKGRKILSQQDKWKRKSSNHRVWSKSFFGHFHVHVFTLTAVNNQNQVTVRPHI